jgi:hypothetical protein
VFELAQVVLGGFQGQRVFAGHDIRQYGIAAGLQFGGAHVRFGLQQRVAGLFFLGLIVGLRLDHLLFGFSQVRDGLINFGSAHCAAHDAANHSKGPQKVTERSPKTPEKKVYLPPAPLMAAGV